MKIRTVNIGGSDSRDREYNCRIRFQSCDTRVWISERIVRVDVDLFSV